jgi:hypothetical protein
VIGVSETGRQAPIVDAGDGRAALRQSALSAWLSLLASSGTLVCCALPALLVTLGAGAALSGLVAAVPQIVWLSEHKGWVFGTAGVLMLAGGVLQWRNRTAPCPLDPQLRAACLRTRRWSLVVYGVSLLLLATGAAFAFVLPALWGGGEG